MATRKTGSRRIVVDGTAYRWRIRHRATNFQADYGDGLLHVAVESAERPGAVLVLLTDRPHPSDWGTEGVVAITSGCHGLSSTRAPGRTARTGSEDGTRGTQ